MTTTNQPAAELLTECAVCKNKVLGFFPVCRPCVGTARHQPPLDARERAREIVYRVFRLRQTTQVGGEYARLIEEIAAALTTTPAASGPLDAERPLTDVEVDAFIATCKDDPTDDEVKWRVALRMFEKAHADLVALRQQVEDTILVAKTDVDAEDSITAYHFKTGAIHRLLAEARKGDGPVTADSQIVQAEASLTTNAATGAQTCVKCGHQPKGLRGCNVMFCDCNGTCEFPATTTAAEDVPMKRCAKCGNLFRYPPSDNKENETLCAYCADSMFSGREGAARWVLWDWKGMESLSMEELDQLVKLIAAHLPAATPSISEAIAVVEKFKERWRLEAQQMTSYQPARDYSKSQAADEILTALRTLQPSTPSEQKENG